MLGGVVILSLICIYLYKVESFIKNQKVLSITAAVSVIVGGYFLVSTKKKTKKGPYKEIPVPKGNYPYVGHLFSLGSLPELTIKKWHEEYGPVISVKMGVKNFVMLSDPQIAHEIFVSQGTYTSDRPYHTFMSVYYSHGGRGLGSSNATKSWKKSRTAALTFLAPRKVDAFTDLIVSEADYSIKRLLEQSEKLGQFNPMDCFYCTSLNVTLGASFGKHVSADDPLFKTVVDVVNECLNLSGAANDMSGFLPILSFLDVIFRKERYLKHFVENIRNPVYRKLMKEALENDKDSFYKQFYALKDEYELDEEDLLVSMSDLIEGGVDTTSISLTWLTINLANNPDVQVKMHQEIDAFITKHGRLPTFEERDQVPYIVAVQRESLRYRPIVPLGVPHVANKDIVVRDYFIPKGSLLASSMTAMHYNPDVYEDPNTFNPDRFLKYSRTISAAANGSIESRDQYNFGWGRRICPAIYLAEVEMFYVVTRMVALTTIARGLDKNGNEISIDHLTHAVDGGLVTAPKPFELRFIPRPNAVIKI
ncbi:unnamed protein product [Cunninghamella blakesleeana]